MKKFLALLIAVLMLTAVFAGCTSKSETPTPTPPASEPAGEETPDGNAGAGTVKTGLAIISSVAKSTSATDKDGLAQTDSLVVAVTVDEGGKILACVIDAVQSKINFSKDGTAYWLDMNIFALRDDRGRLTHFAAIERDVTARTLRESELRSAARTDALTGLFNQRALTQVVAGIWDETATKLDLARAYVEMDDKEAAREILEEVIAEGREEQRNEARAMLERLS